MTDPKRNTLDLWDGLVLVGAVLAAAGVWLIYPPAAMIVAGAAMITAGVRASG